MNGIIAGYKFEVKGVLKKILEGFFMLIGDSFKRFRKEYGLTQQNVADALKIQKSSYQRYEQGKVVPAATVIIELSNFFNVSTDYLLGCSDNPARQ